MKAFAWVIVWSFHFVGLFAQTNSLSGVVYDANTRARIPFVNVFINRTTIGTIASDSGYFELKNLPQGNFEIVFSSLGYGTSTEKISYKTSSSSQRVTVFLKPEPQQLGEFTVTSGRDKTWEKQLKKFNRIFLGDQEDCKITNPWALEFSNENNIFSATASKGLIIENQFLGYWLNYQLKDFKYFSSGFVIAGNAHYTEMQSDNPTEMERWKKNREEIYLGSINNLMRAIVNRKIFQSGFLLFREKNKAGLHSTNFSADVEHNIAPFDTLSLAVQPLGDDLFSVKIKSKMEIVYTYGFTNGNYYRDNNYPVSWIEVKNGTVIVNKEGNVLNSDQIVMSGAMAELRVASMLPLDYKPKTKTAQLVKKAGEQKLQEKIYLHTDRPCYYPGEEIWFSVYMNYQNLRLVDSLSNVVYADLISVNERKSIGKLILPISRGRTFGNFLIPAETLPGNYVIRCYTQWMRNFGIESFAYKPVVIMPIEKRLDENSIEPLGGRVISMKLDKATYRRRELAKISLSLKVDDDSLKNLDGTFSIAVVPESYALSQSQPISHQFIFTSDTNEKKQAQAYDIEKGISVKGLYKSKNAKAKKTFVLIPENLQQIHTPKVESNGTFTLRGLAFYDTASFLIQPADGKIELVNDEPDLPEKLPQLQVNTKTAERNFTKFDFDSTQVRVLKAVTITEKKQEKKYDNAYGKPDYQFTSEQLETYPTLAAAIAAKLPEFKLIMFDGHWLLIWVRGEFLRGNGAPSEPVLYIDGAQVIDGTAGDRLALINPATIDHVEINKAMTTNLGANGANGLINVYTKRISTAKLDKTKPPMIRVKGFDRSKQFQSPDYEKRNYAQPDHRQTLYWNPQLTLSKKEPVNIQFYTSDETGNYRVIIEGVTQDRKPIHGEGQLVVH